MRPWTVVIAKMRDPAYIKYLPKVLLDHPLIQDGSVRLHEKESIASGYAFDRHAVTVFNILSKH